ncbi:hypothetical protein GE09DRAFT_493790 [Coniochaeta sp. 2T2.1]|nr:hypothetical protein GE09DRAFT_493790 [Coniochaeta sp. 2T2.1]
MANTTLTCPTRDETRIPVKDRDSRRGWIAGNHRLPNSSTRHIMYIYIYVYAHHISSFPAPSPFPCRTSLTRVHQTSILFVAMFLPLLLATGASLAAAQNTWSSISTSYVFQPVDCTTYYGPSWIGSVPTSYYRTESASSSVYPVSTSTSTSLVFTTTLATPVTYTSQPRTTVTTTLPSTTTVTITPPSISSTIATMTTKLTVCADGAPAPSSTVTEYKGSSYTPLPGQNTVLPGSFETSETCSVTAITVLHIWPTVQAPTTVTVTTASTTASPTVWVTSTYTSTSTAFAATVSVTAPVSINGHVDLVTSTITATGCAAEAAAPTVTYAAQCKFQNLVGEMEGVGLTIGHFHPNFVFGGVAGTARGDPSLCCQLCVENEGCVASVYWAQSSSCLLGYVGGEEACPVAFDYYAANWTEVPTKARLGNIFQVGAGCGGIRYDGVHT